MITADKVRWGSYREYEGPWFQGVYSLKEVPSSAPLDQKILAVITSTEGGHFDAINMYDRMICTVGLIQWGDAGQFSVCDMLGEVAQRDPSALTYLSDYVSKRGYSFKKTSFGWRFVKSDGTPVTTIPLQQELYLNGCDGKKGSWREDQKEWTRGFVVALQSVWDSQAARDVQTEFTVRKLRGFATKRALEQLFKDPTARSADSRIVEAAQSSYLSFAANLPAVADKQLAALSTSAPKWSLQWLIALLKQLTFGPKIDIYPHRYDAIRPTIEKLWGLKLPVSASALSATSDTASIPAVSSLNTTASVQEALSRLGYDLGPGGADGIIGPRTRAALQKFQKDKGIPVTGSIDQVTKDALQKALV